MKTISLVSFKRRLFMMVGVFCTFIILLAASTAVFAQEPPQSLMRHVASFPVVYDKKCNVPSFNIKNMECIITVDQANDAVYIVLFNDNIDVIDVVRVIVAHGGKEYQLWCSPLACV